MVTPRASVTPDSAHPRTFTLLTLRYPVSKAATVAGIQQLFVENTEGV